MSVKRLSNWLDAKKHLVNHREALYVIYNIKFCRWQHRANVLPTAQNANQSNVLSAMA